MDRQSNGDIQTTFTFWLHQNKEFVPIKAFRDWLTVVTQSKSQ